MTQSEIEKKIVELEDKAFDRYVTNFNPVYSMSQEERDEYRGLKAEMVKLKRKGDILSLKGGK